MYETHPAPAYFEDLQVALKHAQSINPLVLARSSLYLTGLRVASLLFMQVTELKAIYKFGLTGQCSFRLPALKSAGKKHHFATCCTT